MPERLWNGFLIVVAGCAVAALYAALGPRHGDDAVVGATTSPATTVATARTRTPKRVARRTEPPATAPPGLQLSLIPHEPGDYRGNSPTGASDVHHDQRQAVREWWNTTGQDVVVAELAIGLASAAVQSDDLVTASSETKEAQEASDSASHEVLMNVPDGWQDIADAVFRATTDFASAYSRLHEAIDSNKPSDMADALDQARTAHDEMMHAKHLARVRYAAMGGNPDDLTTAPD